MPEKTIGDWRLDAACREVDPELFFPIGSTGPAVGQIAEAKAVCTGCNARAACLGYALRNEIAYGIWGGTTEDERRAPKATLARLLGQGAGQTVDIQLQEQR